MSTQGFSESSLPVILLKATYLLLEHLVSK